MIDPGIPSRRAVLALALALTAGVAAAGCQKREAERRQLVVFAAASLREAFTDLEAPFRASHPDVDVVFHFAGTQELRAQLEHGARADVLASADTKHMAAVHDGKLVAAPVLFARNEPVVVVAADRATSIQSFADLPAATRLVVGAPDVPIGRYTDRILDKVGAADPALRDAIIAHIVSRELNVRQVLAKVSLGEADAGIVYRTDVVAATTGVAVVTIPAAYNVLAEYPIAVTTGAAQPALARDWVALTVSAAGQDVLRGRGFTTGASPAP